MRLDPAFVKNVKSLSFQELIPKFELVEVMWNQLGLLVTFVHTLIEKL